MRKAGDIVIVKVGGNPYETIIDQDGIQRFRVNTLIKHLNDTEKIDLNQLGIDYHNNKFTKEDYMHFCMGLGYSVCGFADLTFFQDLEIENPLWQAHDIRQMGAFQYFFILGLMLVSFPLSFLLLISSGFSTTFEKYAEIADIIIRIIFEFEEVEEKKEKKE